MSSRTNMMKMGKYIAKLRKKKGYTQKNLGDILDVSDKTVSKWEKGVVAPDITLLNSLADTLDVKVEELLAGEDSNTVEAIDMYSKITKKKIIKGFVVLIIIMIIASLLIFKIEEYYAWHITPLYSEGNISSTGFILSNNKESKVVIDKFTINDRSINYDLSQIDYVKIIARIDDKIIWKEEIKFDNYVSLESIFNRYVISFDYNSKICKDDLVIEIDIGIKDDFKNNLFIKNTYN